jgi:hypothetical protein
MIRDEESQGGEMIDRIIDRIRILMLRIAMCYWTWRLRRAIAENVRLKAKLASTQPDRGDRGECQ